MEEIESKLPELKPIGVVKNAFNDPTTPERIAVRPSTISIFPHFSKGLSGLKEGDILLIVFVFHKSEGYQLKIHPRGDARNPKRGVFLTCSPYRPNPIGISAAKVIEVREKEFDVIGLDALNGSPVIDIKPALPILKFFKEMIKDEKNSSL